MINFNGFGAKNKRNANQEVFDLFFFDTVNLRMLNPSNIQDATLEGHTNKKIIKTKVNFVPNINLIVNPNENI